MEKLNVTTDESIIENDRYWDIYTEKNINLYGTFELYCSEKLNLSRYDIEDFDAVVEFLENYSKETRTQGKDFFYFWI